MTLLESLFTEFGFCSRILVLQVLTLGSTPRMYLVNSLLGGSHSISISDSVTDFTSPARGISGPQGSRLVNTCDHDV